MDLPLDADSEDELWFGRNVVLVALLGRALLVYQITLSRAVLFGVAFGALEDDFALLLVGLS